MVVMRCELGHVRNRSISCLLVVLLWAGSVIWFRYHLRHSRFWFFGITAGSDGVASRTGRFALCEECCVLVEQGVGWAQLPVLMLWRREQFCSFAGNRTMKMGVSRIIPQLASTLLSNTSIKRTQLTLTALFPPHVSIRHETSSRVVWIETCRLTSYTRNLFLAL